MPLKIDIRNSAGKLAPGIDVKQTAATCSRRRAFTQRPPVLLVRRYGRRAGGRTGLAAGQDHRTHSNGNGSTPAADWRELVKGVAEGARDCSVAQLAGYLLCRRVDPLVTLQLLQSWNATCVHAAAAGKRIRAHRQFNRRKRIKAEDRE